MHICRAGNGKHQGKQKKKVNVRKNPNYSAYFLKGHLHPAVAPASKSCWFFSNIHFCRIKPITMGKTHPNTCLHNVQGLGQTWGQDLLYPIHYRASPDFQGGMIILHENIEFSEPLSL